MELYCLLDVGHKEEEGRKDGRDTVIPGGREDDAVVNRNNREGGTVVTKMITELLLG